MRDNYHLYKWIITEYNIPDIMPENAHHKFIHRGPRNIAEPPMKKVKSNTIKL